MASWVEMMILKPIYYCYDNRRKTFFRVHLFQTWIIKLTFINHGFRRKIFVNFDKKCWTAGSWKWLKYVTIIKASQEKFLTANLIMITQCYVSGALHWRQKWITSLFALWTPKLKGSWIIFLLGNATCDGCFVQFIFLAGKQASGCNFFTFKYVPSFCQCFVVCMLSQ